MIRRYYSHYTFIYPDTYLKNHIVELDEKDRVISFYPFEKEIENTEFYSGVIVFLPQHFSDKELIKEIKEAIKYRNKNIQDDLDITIRNINTEDNQ